MFIHDLCYSAMLYFGCMPAFKEAVEIRLHPNINREIGLSLKLSQKPLIHILRERKNNVLSKSRPSSWSSFAFWSLERDCPHSLSLSFPSLLFCCPKKGYFSLAQTQLHLLSLYDFPYFSPNDGDIMFLLNSSMQSEYCMVPQPRSLSTLTSPWEHQILWDFFFPADSVFELDSSTESAEASPEVSHRVRRSGVMARRGTPSR
jgi:hypothetical protein